MDYFLGCAFSALLLSFLSQENILFSTKNVLKMKTYRWISVSLSSIFLESVTLWKQKWNVKVQREPYETLQCELAELCWSSCKRTVWLHHFFSLLIVCAAQQFLHTQGCTHTTALSCWPFWKLQHLFSLPSVKKCVSLCMISTKLSF